MAGRRWSKKQRAPRRGAPDYLQDQKGGCPYLMVTILETELEWFWESVAVKVTV